MLRLFKTTWEIQVMDCRQFAVWIMASWLCLVSMGLQYPEDLKHSEIVNGSLFSNSTEDATFNETESVTPNEVSGRIIEETTSHLILGKTTKIPEVTAVESEHRAGLVPLAVGGLALLSGLLFLAFVVGLFMYCNRNSGFVYEPASMSDPIVDV
ncbi:unnamed protein product [Larinioides sclopetarius]|uniref:Uncharacterized protein n=1 Tax=Larinioides sclopetarius TaxID=280406 RepID=A0AAV1Z1U0_9ARAC